MQTNSFMRRLENARARKIFARQAGCVYQVAVDGVPVYEVALDSLPDDEPMAFETAEFQPGPDSEITQTVVCPQGTTDFPSLDIAGLTIVTGPAPEPPTSDSSSALGGLTSLPAGSGYTVTQTATVTQVISGSTIVSVQTSILVTTATATATQTAVVSGKHMIPSECANGSTDDGDCLCGLVLHLDCSQHVHTGHWRIDRDANNDCLFCKYLPFLIACPSLTHLQQTVPVTVTANRTSAAGPRTVTRTATGVCPARRTTTIMQWVTVLPY